MVSLPALAIHKATRARSVRSKNVAPSAKMDIVIEIVPETITANAMPIIKDLLVQMLVSSIRSGVFSGWVNYSLFCFFLKYVSLVVQWSRQNKKVWLKFRV